MPNFKYLFYFLDLIWRFSRNSEGGVRLGMFFDVEMVVEVWRNSVWDSIYGGFGVSKTFLSITYDFQINYLISLR